MNSNIIEKANVIVKSSEAAYIAVIDENEYPSVSTVSTIKTDGIFKVYFATGTEVNKTRRILKNSKASVCCHKGGDNVTLVGEAKILNDKDTKHALWQDWLIDHFPLGKDDPDYCIIEFTTKRVSLWIDHEIAEFTIDEALCVQSRCGLMCGKCEYRQTCNCGGCIETNGHPFHGECPVAACCQNKGYNHCGECSQLPCEQLYQYSCGDGEHGDKPAGARINMLKCWAN